MSLEWPVPPPHAVVFAWVLKQRGGCILLFGALVVAMVSEMPVRVVARIVGERDTLLWQITTHCVDGAGRGGQHGDVRAVVQAGSTLCPKCDYMSHLDDLPKRDSTHRIEGQSKTVFRAAISECEEFTIQSDVCDYGTDFVIEAMAAGEMTNVRVHVQVKGTNCEARADGSVGVSVARTNVNYLFMQPGSIFVCYHIPTERLLVRRVDEVVSKYEHRGADWHDQQTVTVRFKETFDCGFQKGD